MPDATSLHQEDEDAYKSLNLILTTCLFQIAVTG